MSGVAIAEPAAPATSLIQTEVGLLPSDWHVSRLGALLQRPPTYGINAPAIAYDLRFPTYIRITDITDDGRFKPHGRASVSHRNAGAYHLTAGDIVLARTGASTGKSYLYRAEDGELVFAGFLIRVSPDPQKLLPEYLSYQLQTVAYWSWVRTNSMRSGQPGINGQQYASLLIPLPPTVHEQQAIAAALSDADALIEGLESLISKKRVIKQGAMQNLLSGRRSLTGWGSEETPVKDQYGTYPARWRAKPLADLVDPDRPIRYGIVQPGRYDPHGRFMIRGQDYSLAKGWADPSDVFRVSETVEAKYRNARVQAGDLIITIVGYCGHVEKVPGWLDGANLTQTTARLAILPAKANPTFCMYMIRSSYVQSQVSAYLKGNAQPGLNCGDVEKFLLPLPSPEEQAQIAEFLTALDDEIDLLISRLGKARQIKLGMMQELLIGRVRLV